MTSPTDFHQDFLTITDACTQADRAAGWLAATAPAERATLLIGLADALDAAADELVPIAAAETSLPPERLRGEVARTSGQLRLFAAVVTDGACFEVTIDEARPDISPPQPDIRRLLIPLGPVAVFTASNFPFAFSVLGGDTASALAAGCPVVVKTNPGHPQLTAATVRVAREALHAAGAPPGVLTCVGADIESGVRLVQDPRIEAVGFTGSTRAGLALQRTASERARPIPFYGELGSVNPVFVTAQAAAARGAEIAGSFVGSFTLGTGQFCTKPGLLLAPHGDRLRTDLVAATSAVGGQPMLNDAIRSAFLSAVDHRIQTRDVEVLHGGTFDADRGTVTPSLLAAPTRFAVANSELLEECFGPTSLLVEYSEEREMLDLAARLEGVLTATVIGNGDEPILAELMPLLVKRVGRVIFNGWPTGVAVTWSMHHGGPFPATTSPLHTSVGATAIRRFLRPVAWQGWPDHLLPEALRAGNPWRLPRRVNGALTLP